jgi:hypothetical protein
LGGLVCDLGQSRALRAGLTTATLHCRQQYRHCPCQRAPSVRQLRLLYGAPQVTRSLYPRGAGPLSQDRRS